MKILLLTLLLSIVALIHSATAQTNPDEDFVRFLDGKDAARLETATVTFENEAGVKVDLIGVIHIGDADYYEGLNESFKAYDALLYEMVGGSSKEDEEQKKEAQSKKGNPMAFFQSLMKNMLEVEFQLDKIDYKAANFVHADMDWKTFQRLRDEKNENLYGLLDKAVKREQDRPGGFDFQKYFEALNNADSPQDAKMELARQFDQIELMTDAMDGEDGSVILHERNKVAMDVLKKEIGKGGKKLGLFYGAAHLVGMAETMRDEMGFKQVSKEWRRAWNIPKTVKEDAKKKTPAAKAPQKKVRAWVKDTTVTFLAQTEGKASVFRENGDLLGEMIATGNGKQQKLEKVVGNFQEIAWHVKVEGKRIGGGTVKIEHYEPHPDSAVNPDAPKGTVTRHSWNDSKVFPGTEREYLVYVPAQYDPEKPAAVMVWQDGLRHADPDGPMKATTVFDNLIHKGDMPVTIGIFINPGRFSKQEKGAKPGNRSVEYDSLGDNYARFLLEEILPEVGKSYNLTDDPEMRAIAGGSSGGICAWTVAWERPDAFRKVVCWVGTFVDIRGGHAYPSMIRKTEKKPIRAYLLDGENDLDNKYGNWPLANKQMAKALEFMGYDYHFNYGECFHGSKNAGAILPDMLRWIWRK